MMIIRNSQYLKIVDIKKKINLKTLQQIHLCIFYLQFKTFIICFFF